MYWKYIIVIERKHSNLDKIEVLRNWNIFMSLLFIYSIINYYKLFLNYCLNYYHENLWSKICNCFCFCAIFFSFNLIIFGTGIEMIDYETIWLEVVCNEFIRGPSTGHSRRPWTFYFRKQKEKGGKERKDANGVEGGRSTFR